MPGQIEGMRRIIVDDYDSLAGPDVSRRSIEQVQTERHGGCPSTQTDSGSHIFGSHISREFIHFSPSLYPTALLPATPSLRALCGLTAVCHARRARRPACPLYAL